MQNDCENRLDLDIAKVQKIFGSEKFWRTFFLLINVKSLVISEIKNRFGKLS